jgi:hypothetical protein
MKAKIVVVPGQPAKDAERVDIEEARENWNEYRLSDGSTLRVKQVATEIWKLEGEYDPEGNPLYVVRAAGVMTVTAPDNLKKRLN